MCDYIGLGFPNHDPKYFVWAFLHMAAEEGTLAEDDSLQIQANLVLDRREEVRQAP
jgi:ADP-ribose pyrophosphatase YjhB (NUDIX family)